MRASAAVRTLLVAALSIAGATSLDRPSRAAPPAHVTAVRATLPNGLEIVVLPDRVAPVVSTWLNVRAGSDDEPYTGLAHAQEHMFYRGSATLSGTQADEIAGFTGDEDNADTQQIITQYFHTVPSSDLDVVLHLDASRFVGLKDAQSDWNQERGAIEQEVTRDDGDASYRLGVLLQRHLMAGTAYADDGLGTLRSFDTQIGAPQLRAFYERWYHPNDAVYVIAGDVDPAAAIASVRKYFGSLPRATLPHRAVAHLAPLAPASFHDTSDDSSNLVVVGYRYPGLADPDYAASVVLADVLNNRRGAAYELVATGLANDIETDATEFPTAGIATVTAHVPVGFPPARAIAAIEGVVTSYQRTGVPADLVTAAKRREAADVASAGNSIRHLAETWSATLPTEGRTPEQDLAAIARVTPADVDRVLRTYLVNRTAATASAVPNNGDASGAGGGAAAGESKTEPSTLEPLPAWAQSALDRLAPPVAPAVPATFTLANGLHVIVRPDHTSASVAVEGIVAHDAGLEEPPEHAGVGDVVEELMPYGTTSLARVPYQAKIDALSAEVKTGFAFSYAGLSSTFGRGMALLADDELHPAFASQDFAIVRRQRSAAIAGEASSPEHLAEVARANGLYPDGDPARVFATAAGIDSLTLADVKAYYARAFRPDLTTIAIVGDVTPEAARATVERTFGSWTASGPAPNVVPQPVRDNVAASTTLPANGRVQDGVDLVETVALGDDDPDVAPLDVADTLLSGDFSSILIRDMRVTTGYVYYVGTHLRTGRARSTFEVTYGCSPSNYAKAESTLERDLSMLQTTAVPADRLQRAKSRLLSEDALSGASYEALATKLATDSSEGLSPEAVFDRVSREYASTPETVRAALAKWVRPASFVRTIEGPAPT